MKILYYTNVPSPYKVLFLNELSKKNEILVIYNKNEGKKRNKNWYKNNKPIYKELYLNKFPFFQLANILDDHYDAIIIADYATISGAFLIHALRKNNIPFYIHADGGIIQYNEIFLTKFIKTYFLSKATYYLSSGKKTNEYLTYYGANPKNIFLYPFTSLLEKDIIDSPITYEKKLLLRINKGYKYKRLFISVGSFFKAKGYDLFLKALSKCCFNNTGFLIIGGGEKKKNYMRLIKKYNLKNVHLIDFCNKEEVFNYLKMSDVFFFPSRMDIWGLVINEAMACGLPVISSDNVVASIELIDKKFIYPVENINKQTELITHMNNLTNEELYNIGKANINTIRNFTIENMSRSYEEILLCNANK